MKTILFGAIAAVALVIGGITIYSKGDLVEIKEASAGEMCGNAKVEIEGSPDLVQSEDGKVYLKLSTLLATNPCFNFGWFEQNGRVAVINYMGKDGDLHQNDSKGLEGGIERYRMTWMDIKEMNNLSDVFMLDVMRKASDSEMVDEIKKLTKKLNRKIEKETPVWASKSGIGDPILWNAIRNVAIQEGIRVRVSDTIREEDAVKLRMRFDKVPLSKVMEQYEKIFARMSPNGWERYNLELDFAWYAYEDGDYEKAVVFYNKAFSSLRDPKQQKYIIKNIKENQPKIADRILASY